MGMQTATAYHIYATKVGIRWYGISMLHVGTALVYVARHTHMCYVVGSCALYLNATGSAPSSKGSFQLSTGFQWMA